jgi:hypothetical protein
MSNPIDDRGWKAEAPGGGFVADLAIFLNDVRGVDFSAALQIDCIGKNTRGNGRGKAQNRKESEGMRRG